MNPQRCVLRLSPLVGRELFHRVRFVQRHRGPARDCGVRDMTMGIKHRHGVGAQLWERSNVDAHQDDREIDSPWLSEQTPLLSCSG